jgi:hypothetical protein
MEPGFRLAQLALLRAPGRAAAGGRQVRVLLVIVAALGGILLFLLASADTGHILSFGILILGGALLLLYLKESLMLFLSKKISILHWFLYLCAVEIFPVSFVWLSLTRI